MYGRVFAFWVEEKFFIKRFSRILLDFARWKLDFLKKRENSSSDDTWERKFKLKCVNVMKAVSLAGVKKIREKKYFWDQFDIFYCCRHKFGSLKEHKHKKKFHCRKKSFWDCKVEDNKSEKGKICAYVHASTLDDIYEWNNSQSVLKYQHKLLIIKIIIINKIFPLRACLCVSFLLYRGSDLWRRKEKKGKSSSLIIFNKLKNEK